MIPSYAYCALLDVLGYRQRLSEDQTSGTFEFKADLESALRYFENVNAAIFGVQAISDTIIITCTSHAEFIQFICILKGVFLKFLERGLFVRGGVAYSKHFHTQNLTYSHAVARAYEIESHNAVYPRIVLDKNIIDMHSLDGSNVKLSGAGLIAEQNGQYFIHVLDKENWSGVYDLASRAYLRDQQFLSGSERAFGKHVWFERYLSAFVPEDAVFNSYIPNAVAY